MDNNELLSQIASIIEKQTERIQNQMDERFAEQNEHIEKRFVEQDERIEKRFAEQDERIEKRFAEQDERIEKRFAEQDERIEKHFAEQDERINHLEEHVRQIDETLKAQRMELVDMMERQTQKLSILIENSITKRLDALYDARDISLEKDKELEGRIQTLETQMDNVQTRVTVLEAKANSAT